MSFASLTQGLVGAGIRFVVIGGVAGRLQGSPRLTDDLDLCYDATHDNVDRLATVLAEWKAELRGAPPELPFIMDARQIRTTPVMTLTTQEGDIDIFDRVAGIGDYAACLAQSEEFAVFGVQFPALSLPALIASKRATGRRKDAEHLPELEAMLALRDDENGPATSVG